VTADPRLAQELHAVVVAIWYDIDQRDGSGVSAHFAPDGTLTFGGPVFTGRDEIDACYAARAGRGPRVARHVTTNLHVTDSGADSASAVSTLLLFAQDGEPPRPTVVPTMVGDVADEFVQQDGRWLIRARRIDTLFVAPETVLAVPTS
jgi:hypothetical protein